MSKTTNSVFKIDATVWSRTRFTHINVLDADIFANSSAYISITTQCTYKGLVCMVALYLGSYHGNKNLLWYYYQMATVDIIA